MIKLTSVLDTSINYVQPQGDSYFESRFVQRDDSYIIVYLSSHTGCNQLCKFCHLTQTGQTEMVEATLQDFLHQAETVLKDANLTNPALKRVKFNFMARGEPLLNSQVVDDFHTLARQLRSLVPEHLSVSFSISTILPKAFHKKLEEVFSNRDDVTIYYSLYSVNGDFRKRWLPNAHSTRHAFALLRSYVSATGRTFKVHSAFIKDKNDAYVELVTMKLLLDRSFGNNYKFNLVRYNPYTSKQGEESDKLDMIQEVLEGKLVTRVGFDVKASCGMFYNGE